MTWIPVTWCVTHLLQELQQHDAQELNRILFSAIEDSLVGTCGQNLIGDLYHGTIVNQVRKTTREKEIGLFEDDDPEKHKPTRSTW